jgi:hypothetical protein
MRANRVDDFHVGFEIDVLLCPVAAGSSGKGRDGCVEDVQPEI